ncbi:MAG: hypothetical protein HeimC2_13280 [Candidatus Heimdallarchaeota archaeon LC_2]|nr:MAG: hypothetical protein HeimC2_13280 [Candidatus Heimdallarchaeota archaeon LC_2]
MNQKKTQAWLLLFIILGSLLTFASIPYTPAHSIYNEEWNGASEFRKGLETNFNYSISRILVSPLILDSNNNISVMVIIGSERKYSDAENQAYVQFVESGGSLIIFEDFGPSREIAERFGIDFLKGKIKETLSSFYISRPSQIFIFDVIVKSFFPDSNISPMLGSDVVAVMDINGFAEGTTWPLLVTNPTAFLDVNDNDIIDQEDFRFEFGIPVGVFKRIGNGSLTVIGDSSIPLNQYWEKEVAFVNPVTSTPEIITLSNAFWSTMLVAFIAGLSNSTNITFDESHQAISVTSAAGILNLIAGTWVGLINSTAISLMIIALSLVFTGVNFRSRLKSRVFSRKKTLSSVDENNGDLISHPTLAERLLSEQYILYQVMGENYLHVANTHLVDKLKGTGKATDFLKKIEEEYGQDLRSANTFEQLLDLHVKLQYFVEENKNRLL